MIVSSQLALKTHTNFGCAASLATLDKLVDRFLLPPVRHLSAILVSCYEACGTFNYVTNTYCDVTIIYNDFVHTYTNAFIILVSLLSNKRGREHLSQEIAFIVIIVFQFMIR
jgi:hypothetical protein